MHIHTIPAYLVGLDMGAMMPCFISTLGLVLAWNVSLVIHSGPTGSLSDLSYCSLDSNGCGSCDAMYMLFCFFFFFPYSLAKRKEKKREKLLDGQKKKKNKPF